MTRSDLVRTLRRLGPAGVLAVIAGSLPALGALTLLYFIDTTGEWLRDNGLAALGAYVAGFALLTGLAMLSTHMPAALGGWAYHFGLGFPAALGGILGGAAIGYAIARRASGDRVTSLVREHPKWQAVYDALLGSGTARTLLIVTLLRIPPSSPFAITNLVLAATRVAWGPYLLGTLLGLAPRTALVVYLASHLARLDETSGLNNRWIWIGGIVVTIAVILVIGRLAQHAVERVTRTAPRNGVG